MRFRFAHQTANVVYIRKMGIINGIFTGLLDMAFDAPVFALIV